MKSARDGPRPSELPSESAPEPDPLLGRTIAGKFVIERLVGAGSMGAVYRAQQVLLDRPVAIKVMRREMAADPTFAARFHLEAKAASRLDHPNVIRVLDFGQEADGLLYIAMELLDSRALLDVLREEWPLGHERLVDILSQALSALAEAHELGVLHRDLKPENILVLRRRAEDGSPMELVKVCDFGIAKLTNDVSPEPAAVTGPPALAAQRRLTTGGLIIGTPEYMAPEQASGESFDARSDVYAVGVILYQLLTRRLPFEAKTSVEVIFKAMHGEPAPLGSHGPTAAPGLEAICVKAMSRLPDDRFQSAREMRAALRSADPLASELASRLPTGAAAVAAETPEASAAREAILRAETVVRFLPGRPKTARWVALAALLVGAATALLAARRPGAEHATRSPAPSPSLVSPEPPPSPRATPSDSPPTTLATSDLAGPPSPPADRSTRREPRRSIPVAPSPPLPEDTSSAPSGSAPSADPEVAPPALRSAAPPPLSSAPASPSVAAASPPAPSPPVQFNRATARVEIGVVRSNSAAATGGSVTRALRPLAARFTACYRDALPQSAAVGEVAATLHLESDEAGYVAAARLTGDVPSGAGPCIEAVSRSARIAVDTGTANADATLTFKPR